MQGQPVSLSCAAGGEKCLDSLCLARKSCGATAAWGRDASQKGLGPKCGACNRGCKGVV